MLYVFPEPSYVFAGREGPRAVPSPRAVAPPVVADPKAWDMTSPSVSTLVTVCAALSLPVGELSVVPKTDVVRGAEAPHIQLTGRGADERLLTPRGQARLQLVRSIIEPGGTGGDELYTLNCEVEVVHVLRGRLEVLFSRSAELLEAGDTMTFSGREPHTWHNPDANEVSEVLWVIVPAPWDTTA